MKIWNQIVIVNVCILVGLVYEYFKGAPVLPVFTAGIVLLILANVIFFVRLWKSNSLSK
jgi:hypothetical protein